MAGSVNKVILVGNLGKDPESRSMQNGTKVVNLTVATSETWNDKASGERKERTEWHRIVIFNERVADVAERFLKKGRKVYIEGSLQTRKWTDQSGQEKYTTEVVIDRFRGDLVLIDSNRGGSEEGAGDFGGERSSGSAGGGMGRSGGNGFGSGSGGRQERGRSGGSQSWEPARSGGGGDLDDEIPF